MPLLAAYLRVEFLNTWDQSYHLFVSYEGKVYVDHVEDFGERSSLHLIIENI
jgi:hypothetical protein